MTPGEWAAWAQAGAGCLTFASALVAVWATMSAPKRAAEFAEMLRRQSELEDQSRREKTQILTILMQNRASIPFEASVGALNLIPVVFRSNSEVRHAHDHFMKAVNAIPYSEDAMKERYLIVIESIIKCLSLSNEITYNEIREFYDPKFLAQSRAVQQLDVQERFDAKMGKSKT